MISRNTQLNELNLNTLIQISQYLSPHEICYLQLVNKHLESQLMQNAFLQPRFGINHKSYAFIVSTLNNRELIDSHLNGFISEQSAFMAFAFLKIPPNLDTTLEIENQYIKLHSLLGMSADYRNFALDIQKTVTARATIALYEKLITEIELLHHNYFYINVLKHNLGLTYLRKKLPVADYDFTNKYHLVLTPNGISALQADLISTSLIASLSEANLNAILSNEGLEALRSELFTAEDFLRHQTFHGKNEKSSKNKKRYTSQEAYNDIKNHIQEKRKELISEYILKLTDLYFESTSWEFPADNQPGNALLYLTRPDLEMSTLRTIREKLSKHNIKFVIEESDNGSQPTCYLAEGSYHQFVSSLLSKIKAAKAAKQSAFNHGGLTLFPSNNGASMQLTETQANSHHAGM